MKDLVNLSFEELQNQIVQTMISISNLWKALQAETEEEAIQKINSELEELQHYSGQLGIVSLQKFIDQ